MSRFVVVPILTALLFGATSALAQDSNPPEDSEPEPASAPGAGTAPPTERRWYGMQTLGADLVALGLMAAAVPSASRGSTGEAGEALAPIGALLFPIGAPIVHLANGRGTSAAASFLLHLGLPALAFFAAAGGTSNDNLESGVRGLVIGAVAASALDAGLLAWKPVTTNGPGSTKPHTDDTDTNDSPQGTTKLQLSPTFDIRRERSEPAPHGEVAKAKRLTIGLRASF